MINNKKSKILIGCLALLLVLSVGYAYFSQNITINGTATAKGEFDMTVTCEEGISDNFLIDKIPYYEQDNHYKNSSCTVLDDTVKYDVMLQQPGARRNFIIKMKNTGSISATISLENINETKTSCKGNYETGTFENCVDGALAGNDLNLGPDIFAFSDGTNIYYLDDEKALDFINDQGEIILSPGQSAYFFIYADWDINGIGGTSGESASGTLFKENATYKFNYNQVTN